MTDDKKPWPAFGKSRSVFVGNRYGRLVVIDQDEKKNFWRARCDCGVHISVRSDSLFNGNGKSCGCLNREMSSKRSKELFTKHGMSKASEYYSWSGMIQRCTNSKSISFPQYGGRGISVCDRWKNSFQDFILDMGMKPTPKHSLDRINNNGNYEPGNCRWSTHVEQDNNRRTNILVTLDGQSDTVANWARKYKICRKLVYNRLCRGWHPIDALKIKNFNDLMRAAYKMGFSARQQEIDDLLKQIQMLQPTKTFEDV